MNARPVLLRRTSSLNVNVNAPPSSGSGASSLSSGGGGGVGVVALEDAIPSADEDPGDPSMSVSTHKSKTSDLPALAEVFNRASVKSSLDLINDEEEGESSYMNPDDASEYSDIFQNNAFEGGGGWSSLIMSSNARPFLTPSRVVAAMALFMMVAAYLAMNPSGGTSNTMNPLGSGNNSNSKNNPNTASGVGADLPSISHNSDTPNSKEITIGEFHEESVGTPLEHHVHEYNKIRFFDSPDKMKPMISKGPTLYDNTMGGLHIFENVCLTYNADGIRDRVHPDTSLRGLLYFTNDKEVLNNPTRCVPCSVNHDTPFITWGEMSSTFIDSSSQNNNGANNTLQVNHQCGMSGLHAMYASSVGDWSTCIMKEENANLLEELGQTMEPTNVSTVHFFQEPTFLLQFNALDKEQSLFDMLLTYLPHWDKFLVGDDMDGDDAGFPFQSVISHSVKGCLSHSKEWFCEVLHQMYAFGEAKEIPWEGDDNTLYCYKELFYNEVGYYQRSIDDEKNDHSGSLVTKQMFGDFREMLFRKFGLPRRRTAELRAEEAEFEKTHQGGGSGTKTASVGGGDGGESNGDNTSGNGNDDTKIIFYDNKLSEHAVWSEMESLISNVRELEKYQNVKFVTVNGDFSDLTVAQQARKFNEADAVIMAHGQHMANAIFAIDGTYFVEVGCKVESLIGSPHFMELFDGKYRAVERCSGKDSSSVVCVVCKDKESDIFTMNPAAFERLVDDVVAGLEV